MVSRKFDCVVVDVEILHTMLFANSPDDVNVTFENISIIESRELLHSLVSFFIFTFFRRLLFLALIATVISKGISMRTHYTHKTVFGAHVSTLYTFNASGYIAQ